MGLGRPSAANVSKWDRNPRQKLDSKSEKGPGRSQTGSTMTPLHFAHIGVSCEISLISGWHAHCNKPSHAH
jgi:hypothetical protein